MTSLPHTVEQAGQELRDILISYLQTPRAAGSYLYIDIEHGYETVVRASIGSGLVIAMEADQVVVSLGGHERTLSASGDLANLLPTMASPATQAHQDIVQAADTLRNLAIHWLGQADLGRRLVCQRWRMTGHAVAVTTEVTVTPEAADEMETTRSITVSGTGQDVHLHTQIPAGIRSDPIGGSPFRIAALAAEALQQACLDAERRGQLTLAEAYEAHRAGLQGEVS